MKFTPSNINKFLFFKLPSAYITGVRAKEVSSDEVVVCVKHKWINQNPFKSIFWAVQGMAAELATGVLVMREIANSNKKVSMLVTNMSANFTKKATGKILFKCNEVNLVKELINKAIETGEGQTTTLTSQGVNEDGVSVCTFKFEWSVKLKK